MFTWGRAVTLSAVVVVGGAVALAAGEIGTARERVVSYPVGGALEGVAFDLGDGDIEVVGGGARGRMTVERTERFSFDHTAVTRRTVVGGVLRVRSRCPSAVPHSCSVEYRVVVPDNVPVDVTTDGGAVSFRRYRGSARVTTGRGDVDVSGFCGFSLRARADGGDVAVSTTCPPQDLSLRSTTGSVRAEVPTGRYRVDAQSASGSHAVRGVTSTGDAPFSIQALSSAGDVVVEGR
jgi:hypothetical protein